MPPMHRMVVPVTAARRPNRRIPGTGRARRRPAVRPTDARSRSVVEERVDGRVGIRRARCDRVNQRVEATAFGDTTPPREQLPDGARATPPREPCVPTRGEPAVGLECGPVRPDLRPQLVDTFAR